MELFEIRVFIYTFFGLYLILVLGILRLFNAVVTANRLLLKLKESIAKLDSRIISSEKKDAKNVGDLRISLNSLSLSIKNLINQISTVYERISRNSKLDSEKDKKN